MYSCADHQLIGTPTSTCGNGPGQAASSPVRSRGQLCSFSIASALDSLPCTCAMCACLRPVALLPGIHLVSAAGGKHPQQLSLNDRNLGTAVHMELSRRVHVQAECAPY